MTYLDKLIRTRNSLSKIAKGVDVSYNKHSSQINLDDFLSEKDGNFHRLQSRIKDADIFRSMPQVKSNGILIDAPDEEFGLEHTPHVTVLYGLKNEEDYFALKKDAEKIKPFKIKIGEVSSFRREGVPHDVLILKIVSPELSKLHESIKETYDNNYKYPDYNPHCTLSYIKKGTCKDLEGKCDWTGAEILVKKYHFSHRDGYKLEISFSS